MTSQKLYTLRIGKSGISPNMLKEIERQLKQHHRIKIRFSASLANRKDKKAWGEELAKATSSKIIKQIGFTIVLQEL